MLRFIPSNNYLLWIIVLLFHSRIQALPPNSFLPIVVLTPQSSTVDLMQCLEISSDNTPNWDEIYKNNHFTPYVDFPDKLRTPQYYWFKFTVTATFDCAGDPFYLSMKKTESLASYDQIHAYILKNGQLTTLKTGRLVSRQDRADVDFKYALPLVLAKNDTAIVYFRVHQLNKPFVALQPQLLQKSVLTHEYHELAAKFTSVNFIIAGGIFLVFAFVILNLLFYVFDRNRVYLYYACFVFFLLMRIIGGLIDFGHPYWVSPLGYFAAHFDMAASIFYLTLWGYLKSVITLLNIKATHPRMNKRVNRFCQFLIIQIFISAIFYGFMSENMFHYWINAIRLTAALFGLYAILFLIFKINTLTSRILSLGNILFLSTTLAYNDALISLITTKENAILFQYALSAVGVFGELMCISVVIAITTKRIHKENIQLLLAEQKNLLEKQELRRQFASDLHDDIGASISSVALLSARVKALVGNTAPEAELLLNKITHNVQLSIENTQTLVWAVDTRYDKLTDLIRVMKEFSGTLDDIQTFDWQIPPNSLSETIELTPDLKKNLYFIFKESINNAVKYAQSSVIKVEICVGEHDLSLCIQDFGKGFERQVALHSSGLHNIENRAKILRGSATIESVAGKGTRICVNVPLSDL